MKLTDGELEALMPFASGVDLHPKTILMIERLITHHAVKAWQEGFDAGEDMAHRWGHVDSWEDWPENPYRVEDG